MFGSGSEEDIGSGVFGPGVVCYSTKGLIDEVSVLGSQSGVTGEGDGSCVGDECGTDDTDGTSPDTGEKFNDCLDFWVIEGVGTAYY